MWTFLPVAPFSPLYVNGGKWKTIIHRVVWRCLVDVVNTFRIARNVCGDYILQFVVENEVCGFKVCGLLNKSFHTNNVIHPHMTTTDIFPWCIYAQLLYVYEVFWTQSTDTTLLGLVTTCVVVFCPLWSRASLIGFSRQNRDSQVGFMENFWHQWRYRPRKRQAWR